MRLITCILTENDCYQTKQTIRPRGVMVHSTGADNTRAARYVQPLEGDGGYEELIGVLGYNRHQNDWNRSGVGACVHAFIGTMADGSVATVQTLPWTHRGWHAGTGTGGGSANNTHISFEICEDDLTDGDYFNAVYREAVELTAMLCKAYGLDPQADGVVICHAEGYRRGVASGHADVEHWFPRFEKTMDDFRADVAAELKEDEDDMTQEKFNEMMNVYLERLSGQAPSGWSEKERAWAEDAGLIKGGNDGEKHYKSYCTREQMVVFLNRLYELLGGQ